VGEAVLWSVQGTSSQSASSGSRQPASGGSNSGGSNESASHAPRSTESPPSESKSPPSESPSSESPPSESPPSESPPSESPPSESPSSPSEPESPSSESPSSEGPSTGTLSSASIFSPESAWDEPLPAGTSADPESAALVAVLTAEVAREEATQIGPGIDSTASSTPIYVVGADQPSVYVELEEPLASWRKGLQAAFVSVPIPVGARAAAGPDEIMTVYQPSMDRLWEFFHMREENGVWHAAWGGAIQDVSQSPGYYTRSSWPGSAPNWGATASSLSLAGGTMTIAELRAGEIDHALFMSLPFARAGVYASPAQRTDGKSTEPDSIPEGARLRLNPGLDVPALRLPRFTEMMALAAQRYGILIGNQTHQGIAFYAEDPTPTGSNPYAGPGGLYEGSYPRKLLAAFPWSSLEVVKMELHPY
jgi:hypothetical protein